MLAPSPAGAPLDQTGSAGNISDWCVCYQFWSDPLPIHSYNICSESPWTAYTVWLIDAGDPFSFDITLHTFVWVDITTLFCTNCIAFPHHTLHVPSSGKAVRARKFNQATSGAQRTRKIKHWTTGRLWQARRATTNATQRNFINAADCSYLDPRLPNLCGHCWPFEG